ncbi:hypothetical protein GCM10022223_58410 [Kineosporia mesophila]|uniref:Uncharacterized protein n=1 Tax=Kineosporia mesophila TaxID=566012 RepID=A0ABP7AHU9_9ACTN
MAIRRSGASPSRRVLTRTGRAWVPINRAVRVDPENLRSFRCFGSWVQVYSGIAARNRGYRPFVRSGVVA